MSIKEQKSRLDSIITDTDSNIKHLPELIKLLNALNKEAIESLLELNLKVLEELKK